jgi:sRNA-binding regulator protein Hfq
MHKRFFVALMALALAAPVAQADTIHLKNGSVLKGKVASFADDQFIIMLDTGSGRYLSRAMVYVGDVARIEFENAPAGASEGVSHDTTPAPRTVDATPVRANDPATSNTDSARDTTPPRDTAAPRDSARSPLLPDTPRNTPPEKQPRDTDTTEAPPSRQPDSAPAEKPAESKPTRSFDRPADADKPAATAPAETTPPAEAERPAPRKLAGAVRAATIDVVGKRDWTSTGLIVKRGDRIRINASGAVTIDPVTGRTAGPEGTTDLTDPKKLMPDQPTGALIGVIGADNDDFLFIGKSSEFTATRDGLLFLSVNEGNLSDNVGSFKAVIEVASQKRP